MSFKKFSETQKAAANDTRPPPKMQPAANKAGEKTMPPAKKDGPSTGS